jgi:DNA modification methylase
MQLEFAVRELGRIHQGDCLEILSEMNDSSVDLAFADPPFNIGYEYDEYHDKQDDFEYVAWCSKWMGEVHRILKPNGTFWLAIGDEYAAELKIAAKDLRFATRSWVIWYYTFGVNCTRKFSRSHVHLFHFVKDENNFKFNADDSGIRVPSARALVYADKRANPAGRLPDDTWILRPQDLPEGFQPDHDTWYFPRVAGTFAERQGFHGCQMPEQLLGRIVRASSNHGDVVLDPFAGSGTTLAVAKKLGRNWVGCELSEEYVRAATDRLSAIREGDALDGPANPVASAPATANGRRLDSPTVPALTSEPSAVSVANFAIQSKQHILVPATKTSGRVDLRSVLRGAIVDAFYETHQSFSIDWLLSNPKLQADFHAACRDAGLIGSPIDWNLQLLRLRKSGEFPKRGTIKKIHITKQEMDQYRFAAEIAWRLTSDKFTDASLDDIFCSPEMAQHFDKIAVRFAPGHATENYRWAALHLRKENKKVVKDMTKYQFIFRTREFGKALNWERCDYERYSGMPGIYSLLSDDKQHLFVDRTDDLGKRLVQHSSCAKFQKSVRSVALIYRNELPNIEYHEGLKVDLVRRHFPNFNLAISSLSEALAS